MRSFPRNSRRSGERKRGLCWVGISQARKTSTTPDRTRRFWGRTGDGKPQFAPSFPGANTALLLWRGRARPIVREGRSEGH